MTIPWPAIPAGVMVAALLGLILGRMKRRIASLEQALEKSSRNLEQLQHSFQKFVPQEVVEDVIRSGASTHGERIEVTVLFADLVGFTNLSERTPPEKLVSLLNGYFEAMSRALEDNRGHVVKFIGDGILALFGAPNPNPWQAIDGVNGALAMQKAMEQYNASLTEKGLPILKVGIGVHIGQAVAGVIGSRELVEYTVIGDTVNTASRIESLTRKVGANILISQAVKRRLDKRFRLRDCGSLPVKGKSRPVKTFAVEGLEAELPFLKTRPPKKKELRKRP